MVAITDMRPPHRGQASASTSKVWRSRSAPDQERGGRRRRFLPGGRRPLAYRMLALGVHACTWIASHRGPAVAFMGARLSDGSLCQFCVSSGCPPLPTVAHRAALFTLISQRESEQRGTTASRGDTRESDAIQTLSPVARSPVRALDPRHSPTRGALPFRDPTPGRMGESPRAPALSRF